MKILRLLAENIKKIKAIDITPPEDEAVVLIGGMNDQGKTSALDTIQLALDPDSLKKAVSMPLREGADHGQIVLDLGEGNTVQVEVSRTYTGNGTSYLNVWADGEKVKSSPQAFLDALIGALAFDPQAFAKMESARQRATLLDLVRLDIDLPALEAEYATAFEARTSLNRDLKQHQGALAQIPVPAPDLPETELSATDLLAAIQAAQDTRLRNGTQRQQLEALRSEAATAKKGVEDCDREIRELEARLQALRAARDQKQVGYTALLARGRELAAQVAGLVDPDLDALREQLRTLEERNQAIRNGQQYRAAAAEVARLQRDSEGLTARLQEIQATKDAALRRASFPIEGLGFSDDGVTFQGIPFHQASSSQQLRVSLAIAMALNPTLRIIRISDGSLLDDHSMAIIREMAQAKDYQIWIEVVGDRVGIQIEDGLVKGAPLPAPIARRSPARKRGPDQEASGDQDGGNGADGGATPENTRPTAASTRRSVPKPVAPAGGLNAVAPPIFRQQGASPAPAAPRPPVLLRTPVYARRSGAKPE